jgi:hypothetical protein
MTNITRVIKDLIEVNTYAEITANVGNTEPVTVDSIVYADQTWANTSNTSVTSAGGYIKLYGKGFETNANVLFGSTVATANVQSANEIQVNVPALSTGTYTMFLYNPSGSNAIKYKSIPVQGDYNYGWFVGGQSGTTIISSVERIDFNNDTVNTDNRGSLLRNSVFHSSAGTIDNLYLFGGANTAAAAASAGNGLPNSYVLRITYANDETQALLRVFLLNSYHRWSASTSSKNYAYTSGGYNGAGAMGNTNGNPANSITDRLDFSNDSSALTTKGPLSIARMKFSSASSDNYGWYIGGSAAAYWYKTFPAVGYTATIYSLVDRLNFNSDTTTAVVRGPLTENKSFTGTTNNNDYAWISAGIKTQVHSPPSTFTFGWASRIERMTFSSDNLQMVVRVPSSTIAQAGAGNENYGWFTGGFTAFTSPSSETNSELINYSPTVSSIFRLEYSNDTTTAANRSSFFQARKFHTGDSGVVS